jgi:hypothetical protein
MKVQGRSGRVTWDAVAAGATEEEEEEVGLDRGIREFGLVLGLALA